MSKVKRDASQTEHEKHLVRLLQKREALHPDLRLHVVGGKLSHPLVVESPYYEGYNAWINFRYRLKKKALAEAIRCRDWLAYLLTHELAYYLEVVYEAFNDDTGVYRDKITDAEFWKIVGTAFTETEYPFDECEEFTIPLLISRRPNRVAIMTRGEQKAFHALPNTFTVYRGYAFDNAEGWSWTLSRQKARWFATRMGRFESMLEVDYAPRIAKGTVAKQDVIAYFTRRDEEEIVVDPLQVRCVSHKSAK